MNTQGQHENSKKAHAINHVGTEKVAKRIKRTAGKVARKVRTLEGRASSMIDKGEDRVVSAAKGMTDWSYRAIAWLYGHDADAIDSPAVAAAGH